MKRPFSKHPGLTIMVALIPLIIIVFLVIFYQTQQRITAVQEENFVLQERVEQLERENLVYKRAYNYLVEDVKRLSQIYGGEERFLREAADIRLPDMNVTRTTFQDYVAEGVVSHSCLTSHPVPPGVVEVRIEAINSSPASLDVYIDAQKVQALQLGNSSAVNVSVVSTHEIALLSSTGGVNVRSVTIGGEPVLGQVDLGAGWAVFDCEELSNSTLLSEPGAYRVLLNAPLQ